MAFFIGQPEDSTLRIRKIADCQRVLCAAPEYVQRMGMPQTGADLIAGKHECLNLRFPGATEFQWQLETPEGPKRFAVSGQGIAMKPVFAVSEHLKAGWLVPVEVDSPPVSVQMACLNTHRRHQDPKARLFVDFMIVRIGNVVRSSETSE